MLHNTILNKNVYNQEMKKKSSIHNNYNLNYVKEQIVIIYYNILFELYCL